MFTEDEAKTKWCAFTRHSAFHTETGLSDPACNRHDKFNNPPYANCIGSACMAWRWAQKPNPVWRPYMNQMSGDPRNDPPMYVADETRGYCGLAGKPEVSP